MGCKERDLPEGTSTMSSSSLNDALLFTTMCIIGFEVEVQVKDGSVYSGIFHTASVEKDYGVVLKKAMMIKKGKKCTSLAHGSVIDTLVILSGDLVQVIAKGVMLPADGISSNVAAEDAEAASGSIRRSECLRNELQMIKSTKPAPAKRKQSSQLRGSNQNKDKSGYGLTHGDIGDKQIRREIAAKSAGTAVEFESKKIDGGHPNKIEERFTEPVIIVGGSQVGEDEPQLKEKGSVQKFEAHKSKTIHGQCSTLYNNHSHICCTSQDTKVPQLVLAYKGVLGISASIPADSKLSLGNVSSDGQPDLHDCERLRVVADAPESSTSSTKAVHVNMQSSANHLASPTVSVASADVNTNSKDFKLNPEAKTFLPVLSVPRSVAPPAAVTTTRSGYIQNSPVVVPVAGAQADAGINPFAPHSSSPIKFVHYNNVVAVNDVNASQYPQPIGGHVTSRPQPVRYGGHYAPFQEGPTYVHPNFQSVFVSRLGQHVYVHPFSHDIIQNATAPSIHALFSHPQTHLPKQQGITGAMQGLQICVAPPPLISSGGQQPYTLPLHIPVSQPPFPTVRSIPLPVPNTHFVSKFF
ncbi:hypothetical protein C5167_019115 [Papaver somniferum]|uniref:Ataxin 2 SM domain-containing protein n=1 Tax=Papaver somniferum TaxID=3469 RepID=A0A4Y7ISL1_PAPSO|nr:hypothetical protein C5167_019115 [Papaver somniferum]